MRGLFCHRRDLEVEGVGLKPWPYATKVSPKQGLFSPQALEQWGVMDLSWPACLYASLLPSKRSGHMTLARTAITITILSLTAACGSSSTESQTSSTDRATASTDEQTVASSTTSTIEEPPTTEFEPSTTAASDALGVIIDMEEGEGPLDQALYRTLPLGDQVGFSVSGEVHRQWHGNEILVLARPTWDQEDISVVVFAEVVGVIPPAEAGVHHPHEPAVPAATELVPDNLGVWLESIDQVTVLDEGVTEVLGQRATWTRFEVDSANGDTFECPFGPECVGLVVNTEGVFAFVTGEQYRFYQFDALPRIIAWERSTSQTTDEVHELMNELIDGLVGI